MVRIAVVGSMNMDIVSRVESAPQAGETVHSLQTEFSPGGKGANQAIAAARVGAKVDMFGAIGDDPFGKTIKEHLLANGVNMNNVIVKSTNTGLAHITLENSGENRIIISGGANACFTLDDMQSKNDALTQSEIILVQNEIPMETIVYTLETSKRLGKRIIYNPAPAIAVNPQILALADVLIVNETEASSLAGIAVESEQDAQQAVEHLLSQGCQEVILTMGGKGLLYCNQSQQHFRLPAFNVSSVDSTAAGDTFVGVFAVKTAENSEIYAALHYASAAAALTVTRQGAQASIPTRQEIDAFISRQELS